MSRTTFTQAADYEAARNREADAAYAGIVEDLKVSGHYFEAGSLAFTSGASDNYGCHYGMRSTRESAAERFRAGWRDARNAEAFEVDFARDPDSFLAGQMPPA